MGYSPLSTPPKSHLKGKTMGKTQWVFLIVSPQSHYGVGFSWLYPPLTIPTAWWLVPHCFPLPHQMGGGRQRKKFIKERKWGKLIEIFPLSPTTITSLHEQWGGRKMINFPHYPHTLLSCVGWCCGGDHGVDGVQNPSQQRGTLPILQVPIRLTNVWCGRPDRIMDLLPY